MGKRTGKVNGPIAPWKHRRTEVRRKAAEERNEAYNKLTPKQKIERLDRYMHVATKERAKIAKLIKNV
jgi:hypothetical protein